jgi:hypothetical protein
LVSRGGSHLVGYVLLLALLILNEKNAPAPLRRLDWLIRPVASILWPVSTLLSSASAGLHNRQYFLALALTLLYAALLFALADQFLTDKDLLWME